MGNKIEIQDSPPVQNEQLEIGAETLTEKDIKDDITGLYSVAAYAKLYGIRITSVEHCMKEGHIKATPVKIGRRTGYYINEHTTSYIKDLREKASGRAESNSLEKLKEQKLKADIALKEAQGELHEMKNEIAKGKYLEREEVRIDVGKFMLNFKKFALSIPSRVAGNIAGRLEPLEVRAIENDLQEEITKLLDAFVVAGVTDEEDATTIKLPKVGRPKKKSL